MASWPLGTKRQPCFPREDAASCDLKPIRILLEPVRHPMRRRGGTSSQGFTSGAFLMDTILNFQGAGAQSTACGRRLPRAPHGPRPPAVLLHRSACVGKIRSSSRGYIHPGPSERMVFQILDGQASSHEALWDAVRVESRSLSTTGALWDVGHGAVDYSRGHLGNRCRPHHCGGC